LYILHIHHDLLMINEFSIEIIPTKYRQSD